VTVRGTRAALPARKSKAEVVLVAARYGEGGLLKVARGFVRHDQIWSDVKLFDSKALVDRLHFKQHVATGRLKDLATDFSLLSTIDLKEVDGHDRLLAKGSSSESDDLGLPIF
jgi:hypothetical protein